MEIGTILKKKRMKKGLSQQELANKAGVTKRAIIYWENGQRQMSVANADKVFKALDDGIVIGKGGRL